MVKRANFHGIDVVLPHSMQFDISPDGEFITLNFSEDLERIGSIFERIDSSVKLIRDLVALLGIQMVEHDVYENDDGSVRFVLKISVRRDDQDALCYLFRYILSEVAVLFRNYGLSKEKIRTAAWLLSEVCALEIGEG